MTWLLDFPYSVWGKIDRSNNWHISADGRQDEPPTMCGHALDRRLAALVPYGQAELPKDAIRCQACVASVRKAAE